MSSPEKNFKSRFWFRLSVTLGILLAFGAVRMPIEARLTAAYRKAYFHGATLNMSLRQQIGQAAFLAALGGFRSVVAEILWIKAHMDWERTEWGSMLNLFNNVTALQPRNITYWDMSSWHMAYNASVAAAEDPNVPLEALRLKHQHEYFLIGKDLLERGIAANPDRYKLHESLGNLLDSKFQDHCGAAVQYAEAARFPDTPEYVREYVTRFAAYELAQCPGHEREAYEQMLALYKEGKKEWLPTLLLQLKDLQEKLNIPESQRINIPENELPPQH